ncbi:MAG: DUF2062 domain-containing protein [Pseudomonadota bacterium]
MPRRFFRSISPSRHSVIKQRWLLPLRHLLDHPDLWAIRRRSVAPAVALGAFWMWMPIPGHSFTAGLSAIALRVQLPLTMLMTMIVNPLTILPMYYLGYQLGRVMLGIPERPFTFDASFDWLAAEFSALWLPMLVGNVFFGLVSAVIGFVLIDLVWRTRIGGYLQRRRERRAARREARLDD